MNKRTTKTTLGGQFTFPGTKLTVQRMGYGAMQLAGPGVYGPPKDPDAAVTVLREAVTAGVNHIDTSDFYGPHVTNQIIRKALHPYPSGLVIVTKLGARRPADQSWQRADSPQDLADGVHDNLRNLGLDALDIVNTEVNPDPDVFLQMEVNTLTTLLPNARFERLPPDSEIFHNVFLLPDGLPHTYMNDIYNPAWAKHGLYAVYSDKRLVSMISLSGLQCGWDGMKRGDPEHIINCMKMMINIYTYVTMH